MNILTKILDSIRVISGRKPFCSAVIVAAGSSRRMGSVDKLYAMLGGMPVIARTLSIFQASDVIDEIVVVVKEDGLESMAKLCTQYGITKLSKIVVGGAERINSVYAGVMAVSSYATHIAIQDGARPLITDEIITATVKDALRYNAAAPAVPVTDTIKTVKDSFIASTVDRSTIYAVQTPQVFASPLIKGALQNAIEKNLSVTDDCSAVEALGMSPRLSAGSYENIKITTPVDLIVAGEILKSRGAL